jgi:hypothetical protein
MLQARLAWPLRFSLTAVLATGCLPSIADFDQGPLTSTFAVSDYFAPSGYMGDGEYFGKLIGTANEGCKPRAGLARGNCYAFTYFPNDVGVDPWAGVFWVFPSNQWGSSPGRAIDISKFKQISFWAAVDGPSPYAVNGNAVPFVGQAGGIDPKGRYASRDGGGLDYVDGVNVNNAWTVGDPAGVTSEMRQFHIPVDAFHKYAGCQDPALLVQNRKAENCAPGDEQSFMNGTAQATYLIGAFAWALHYPSDVPGCSDPKVDCHNPIDTKSFVNPPPVHIYLDDIVWDTQDPPAAP